jgi:hypothetical protein
MKILKYLLIGLVILVALCVLVGGYLGLIPGISSIFGSDKARDLGVVTSQTLSAEAAAKVDVIRSGNPASAEKITYEGSHPVALSLSSEEISSLLAKGTWKYNPVAGDFQMKINQDGTVEASGLLDRTKLDGYLAANGLTDVRTYASMLSVLPTKVPFYVKGAMTITDNKVSMQVTTAQVGRLSFPTDATTVQAASQVVEREISHIPGLNVSSLTFSSGKMHFVGTHPSRIEF